MTSISTVLSQQREALEEIRAICEELDPEGASQLTRYMPGGVLPNSTKRRAEFDLFMLEALAIFSRAHAEAHKPRKRGRPRKSKES